MADNTNRFGLNTYSQGDTNWDHTDTVQTIDELAIERGTVADRPASGDYDDELYLATDQQILYRWDADATDWIVEGVGSETDPLPKVWANEIDVNALEAEEATIGEIPAYQKHSEFTIDDNQTGPVTVDLSDISPEAGTQVRINGARGFRTRDSVEIRMRVPNASDGDYWYEMYGGSKNSNTDYIQIKTVETFEHPAGWIDFTWYSENTLTVTGSMHCSRDNSDYINRGGAEGNDVNDELVFFLPDEDNDEWTSGEFVVEYREIDMP